MKMRPLEVRADELRQKIDLHLGLAARYETRLTQLTTPIVIDTGVRAMVTVPKHWKKNRSRDQEIFDRWQNTEDSAKQIAADYHLTTSALYTMLRRMKRRAGDATPVMKKRERVIAAPTEHLRPYRFPSTMNDTRLAVLISQRVSGISWQALSDKKTPSGGVSLQETVYRYLTYKKSLTPSVVQAMWQNTSYKWLANKLGAPSESGEPVKGQNREAKSHDPLPSGD